MSTERIFDNLVERYYSLYPYMERIPVNIILTDNLNRTHIKLRQEFKDILSDTSDAPYNEYNGRMVLPYSIDKPINILINSERIKQYSEDGSLTWVGTLSHELTHSIDYYQLARRDKLTCYDPLEDISSYHMFQLWSEYHARKLGYRFLREYHRELGHFNGEQQQKKNSLEIEWPFHQRNYYKDYHSGIDGNQQMYLTMQLLGRYSVWCDLFPDVFNEQNLSLEYYNTPWMGHLFSFLRKHESLDKIYPNFDGLRFVLTENWSFLEKDDE